MARLRRHFNFRALRRAVKRMASAALRWRRSLWRRCRSTQRAPRPAGRCRSGWLLTCFSRPRSSPPAAARPGARPRTACVLRRDAEPRPSPAPRGPPCLPSRAATMRAHDSATRADSRVSLDGLRDLRRRVGTRVVAHEERRTRDGYLRMATRTLRVHAAAGDTLEKRERGVAVRTGTECRIAHASSFTAPAARLHRRFRSGGPSRGYSSWRDARTGSARRRGRRRSRRVTS